MFQDAAAVLSRSVHFWQHIAPEVPFSSLPPWDFQFKTRIQSSLSGPSCEHDVCYLLLPTEEAHHASQSSFLSPVLLLWVYVECVCLQRREGLILKTRCKWASAPPQLLPKLSDCTKTFSYAFAPQAGTRQLKDPTISLGTPKHSTCVNRCKVGATSYLCQIILSCWYH